MIENVYWRFFNHFHKT